MNDNKMATIILYGRLCLNENTKPYTTTEFYKLNIELENLKLKLSDLISFSKEQLLNYFDEEKVNRIENLKNRSGSIAFELQKFNDLMINIITLEDECYPKQLKKKLGKLCPPLFYTVGDLTLCNKKAIGFVGSRNISDKEIYITKKLVEKANEKGYAIVSGGAKGIDTTSTNFADYSIEYVADSLIRKLKNKDTIKAIREKKLVILSANVPNAGFHAGLAMARNKFIYAQSEVSVVIKCDYNKGGTWNGSTDAIKKELCPVFCVDDKQKGNSELIKKGAIAINENWDMDISNVFVKPEQLSLM